jgi:hypothetical protein
MNRICSKIQDNLWIWSHEAGSHNNSYGLKGISRMTPTEGAYYLGVPNLIFIRYNYSRPFPSSFKQYALPFTPLKHVMWSITGAGGQHKTNEVDVLLKLASVYPNICGAFMDDFFRQPDEKGQISAYSRAELKKIKEDLKVNKRRLDLAVTLYTNNLDIPNIEKILQQIDILAFWTWEAKELKNLENNFNRLESFMPSSRKMLGCYMWDYGKSRPIPISLMRHQCNLGIKWLHEKRIEGMIFLASCICDLELEAVEWTRKWILNVGKEEI